MLSTIALFTLSAVLAAFLPAAYRALALWERSLVGGDSPSPAPPLRMSATPGAMPSLAPVQGVVQDLEAERRRVRDFWAQRGVSVPDSAPGGITGPEIERPLVQQIR